MKKTKTTGQTCVGDLRLTPLDVGFDLRLHGMAVKLPEQFASVGIEEGGQTYLVEGTREEMVAAIEAAGYQVDQSDKPNQCGQCGEWFTDADFVNYYDKCQECAEDGE